MQVRGFDRRRKFPYYIVRFKQDERTEIIGFDGNGFHTT